MKETRGIFKDDAELLDNLDSQSIAGRRLYPPQLDSVPRCLAGTIILKDISPVEGKGIF